MLYSRDTVGDNKGFKSLGTLNKIIMKKLSILILGALLISGCANEERNQFQDKLAARLATDPDLKDYQIDSNELAECVVSEIAKTLPGFRGTPARRPYWQAYLNFESARNGGEASQAIQQAKDIFGSEQKASAAALSITEYIMHCMGKLIESGGAAPERHD